MQLISNGAQATVVPVPGPRQIRTEPTCTGAVGDEIACRQQTMTLTAEHRRALLGAGWFQMWGEELPTRPTRNTSIKCTVQ